MKEIILRIFLGLVAFRHKDIAFYLKKALKIVFFYLVVLLAFRCVQRREIYFLNGNNKLSTDVKKIFNLHRDIIYVLLNLCDAWMYDLKFYYVDVFFKKNQVTKSIQKRLFYFIFEEYFSMQNNKKKNKKKHKNSPSRHSSKKMGELAMLVIYDKCLEQCSPASSF